MEIHALPPQNAKPADILEYIQTKLLGFSFDTITQNVDQNTRIKNSSRHIKIHFNSAEITASFNIYNICDICLIKQNEANNSTEFYDLCNLKFNKISNNLWKDGDTIIQYHIESLGIKSIRVCLKPLCQKEKAYA